MAFKLKESLPVTQVMGEATRFVSQNAGRLFRAVLPAGIILCFIQYVDVTMAENSNLWASVGLIAAQGVLYAFVAINVHRIALLGDDAVPSWGIIGWSMRESRFIGWLFLIYIAMVAAIFGPMYGMLILASWADIDPMFSVFIWFVIMLVIYLGVLYLLSRVMMVFPATAVDRKPSPNWSWSLTEGNGWRIFLATMFLPGLIFGVIGALLGVALIPVHQFAGYLILLVIGLVGMVWAIAILSYSYRNLMETTVGAYHEKLLG